MHRQGAPSKPCILLKAQQETTVVTSGYTGRARHWSLAFRFQLSTEPRELHQDAPAGRAIGALQEQGQAVNIIDTLRHVVQHKALHWDDQLHERSAQSQTLH